MQLPQLLRKQWGRDPRCWILYSTFLGSLVGFSIAWWYNRPWIEFEYVAAAYQLEAHEIFLDGYYQVNRECGNRSPLDKLIAWLLNKPLLPKIEPVWRNEALATDGQIALYGPLPAPPDLSRGEHRLHMRIPLLAEIYPDGWKATARAYCPGERPETVISPLAVVVIRDVEESPP